MSRLIVVLLLIHTSTATQDKKEAEKKKVAPPMVLYAIPLVVKPGEKQKITLRGHGLAGVKDVKVTGADDATVKVLGSKAVNAPNNYPVTRVGDSEVEIELELPKDTRPGAVKLTAIGPGGESTAYSVLIRDALPLVAEKEPNEGFEQAQAVTIPVAIEGTIRGERDVDVFKFEGKKGDQIHIEIQAARFGSPLDALVVLYDANRAVIDSVDDIGGSSDPVLDVKLPKDGVFYVSVIDSHDLGGPNFGYRLVLLAKK